MDDIKRRNRNNRTRGGAFEKSTADFLDMFVVPYSGSNDRFGLGDIRDVEGRDGGRWLGECKNITMKPNADGRYVYNIQKEWLDGIMDKADKYDLMPFLAFMRSGTNNKWVVIPDTVIKSMSISMVLPPYGLHSEVIVLKRKNKNMVNFHIDENILQYQKRRFGSENINMIRFGYGGPDDPWFHVMSLDNFRKLLHKTNWHAKWEAK